MIPLLVPGADAPALAVHFAVHGRGDAEPLAAIAAEAGALSIEPWPIAGWWIARGTDAALASAAAALRAGGAYVTRIEGADRRSWHWPTEEILLALDPPADAGRPPAGADRDNLRAWLESLAGAGSEAREWGALAGGWRVRTGALDGDQCLELAALLAAQPGVRFAEPDWVITGRAAGGASGPGAIGGDALFAEQWALSNTGQTGGIAGIDLQAPQAWGLCSGSPSAVVCVIDVGIQLDHPELAIAAAADFTGEGGGGGPVGPCDNHGTSVAGCVAARADGLGLCGIAPGARLASARAMTALPACDGSWTALASWTADALAWAQTVGARATLNANSYALPSAAIDAAYAAALAAGLVNVASAGDAGAASIDYPARLPSVIAVGAIDAAGARADFGGSCAGIVGSSNTGAELALAAPGKAILTTDRTAADGDAPGDTVCADGSSYAAAYAAGAAALLAAQNGFASAPEIRAALEAAALDLGAPGWDAQTGHGLVRCADALLAGEPAAGTTRRIDLSSLGVTTLGDSYYPALSADGRMVAYDSAASGLVPGDVDGDFDVYFCDLFSGETTQASVDSAGAMVPESAGDVEISADGRFAVYTSISAALVAGDTNLRTDVFVRDRVLGLTTLESPGFGGAQSNGHSSLPAISADGARVVFYSKASNLVPGDLNAKIDVFLRDREAGTTARLSLGLAGAEADGNSSDPQISADGAWAVFESFAANLAGGDGNGTVDVFLCEIASGALTLVSRGLSGGSASGDSFDASVSGDGARVCFHSTALDLVPGDSNGRIDVFAWERATGVVTRASVASTGLEGNGDCFDARIAGGGSHVAFYSEATNLVAGDTNGWVDCFVRDLEAGATERVSLTAAGTQIDSQFPSGSTGCGISWDGRLVAFESKANSVVPGDGNTNYDLFVHDRRTSAAWFDLGGDLGGAPGAPTLEAWGGLASSGSTLLRLRGLQPLTVGAHVLGLQRLDLPLFGGLLVPSLDVLWPFAADVTGGRCDVLGWPAGLAAGVDLFVQSWAVDAGAPQGLAATRALWARTY